MKKTLTLLIMLAIGATLLTAETSDGYTEWDNGILYWKSDDGQFATRMDVRIYFNGAYFFDDTEHILSNQTNLRKARLALKVKFWGVWHAEWDINVSKEYLEVEDMFIRFAGFPNSHIKFGNFKMALGLNELTSSRFLTFCERAYPMTAFEADRRFGLEYSRWQKFGAVNMNFRGDLFGQGCKIKSKSVYQKEVDETGNGVAARLVLAPEFDDLLIHVGFASVLRKPDDELKEAEFKSEPETKIGDIEFLDTGTIKDVDYTLKFGLEGAVRYNNICLQAEYITAKVARINDQKEANFSGGYAFISWILTGEQRPWELDSGEFGQVIPKSNKLGAWELAARYSYLNLTDEDAAIYGGKANNYTFGLNWYANPNLKFQLNYTMVDNSKNADSDGDYDGNYDFNYIQGMVVVNF